MNFENFEELAMESTEILFEYPEVAMEAWKDANPAKTRWDVKPLYEVNGIKFGMKRNQIRKILGDNFTEFKKNKFSKNDSDDYGFCHIYYNAQDEFDAIEIFEFDEIYINNKPLFPGTIEKAKVVINDLEKDGNEFISRSRSIGISVSNGQMRSILFGSKGYYS